MSRELVVSDRVGRSIVLRSVSEASRVMGVSRSTIRSRLRDGNWIHRDGYVPVRVRTA